jgi:hypothetical protein
VNTPKLRYVVTVGDYSTKLDHYAPVGLPEAEVILLFEGMGMDGVKFEHVEWDSWAWPGGYPLYYLCKDGGVLCPKCANDNIKLTADADAADDWKLVAVDINYEDDHLVCDHCGELVESAYGEPDAPDHEDDGQALASAGHGTDEDYGSAEDML